MDFDISTDLSDAMRAIGSLEGSLSPAQSQSLRDGMESALDVLLEDSRDQFIAASLGGSVWQPRSPNASKADQGKPLMGGANGAICNALFTAGAEGHYREIDESGILAGVRGGTMPGRNVSIEQVVAWQNDGTRTIPARPLYLPPSDSAIVRAQAAIAQAIDNVVQQLDAKNAGGNL